MRSGANLIRHWFDQGLDGIANFLPSGCLSDHSPCIVSLLDVVANTNRPFRFFNMWASHTDFNDLVATNWNLYVRGTKQFMLCKKLKHLKRPLKELNNKHFSHISSRAAKAKEDLERAQLQLHDDPTNVDLQNFVATMRKQSMSLSEAERCFYYQKVKCKHLNQSDRGTKFFHDLVKRNKKRNQIVAICKEDGLPTTSMDEVAKEFTKFYECLLGTMDSEPIDPDIINVGPSISLEQASNLERDISRQEIRDALFDIGEDKSLGPDGFNSCFFKNSWQIVGDDFCAAIEEFFVNGSLLKQINHTVIALVPKGRHAQSVGDYRPISNSNVFYKVITKIMVKRMAPLLENIVDQAQAAFVGGRLMTENIHLAQELLRQYNRLGFPSKFTHWIMECVTSPSYSIKTNGSLYGKFAGKKGLRQGDPLSPFLFVLCLEYFSRLINLAANRDRFSYHPKCAKLNITHLAFADDLMLFSKGDINSVGVLLDCLNKFSRCSGLRANLNKSSLYIAGINGQKLVDIHRIVNMPIGSMPFKYLGIPLAAEKLKAVHYASLVEKNCVTLMLGRIVLLHILG
ncbi:hypothetical protein DH2020_002040 [Rehmannia glutinosa]|uniref:Reverse transcriptase domain-containing protein n=1 Tax=Rehmannia glutinosa TaxID=99300 RepID=A0ABR0XSN6_REHGL